MKRLHLDDLQAAHVEIALTEYLRKYSDDADVFEVYNNLNTQLEAQRVEEEGGGGPADEPKEPRKRTLQAALALSPTNKASTVTREGDLIVIQSYPLEQKYALWVVPENDIPVWGGILLEQDIDDMQADYTVDPGARIWQPVR
jgi:hypothetical protein